MKVLLKRCRVCHILGVGPNAVELSPMGGMLWCAEHWRDALTWEVSRDHVIGGIKRELTVYDVPKVKLLSPSKWEVYILEQAEMAAIALEHQDKKSFTHYFARAMYAWELRSQT